MEGDQGIGWTNLYACRGHAKSAWVNRRSFPVEGMATVIAPLEYTWLTVQYTDVSFTFI